MVLPYWIEADIVEGPRRLGSKIKRVQLVPAMVSPRTGRQIVFTERYPDGLNPGVYSGWRAILTEQDLKPK